MVSEETARGRPPASLAGGSPTLLVLPGWDDDPAFYQELCSEWHTLGLKTAVVPFPQAHAGQTRREHLRYICQACEKLTGPYGSQSKRLAVLGVSYGAYLAVLLAARRQIAHLLLRAPAIYADAGWDVPKEELDETTIEDIRHKSLTPADNQALEAASAYRGHVVVVESELDAVVPHRTCLNYHNAFSNASTRQLLLLRGGDHPLSAKEHKAEFAAICRDWTRGISNPQIGG